MPKKRDKSKDQDDWEPVDPNGGTWRQKEYNDGIYTGLMKKGVRDGTGTLRERNGSILYEGEWKGDKPHGYGKKYFPRTHDRHEGSYARGERHGLGIYLWANGDKYSGDWDVGLMHGRGRFEWAASGEVYNGHWVRGKMTGEGIKVQSDGCRLQGSFLGGELNGWGEKNFPGGDRYAGYFKLNSREGYGEYVWVDGSRYKGTWKEDQMHGQGELITALDRSNVDRDRLWHRRSDHSWLDSVISYRGEFSCGRLHGHGTALMFDGSTYIGAWREDRFEGWGRVRYADSSEFEGDMRRGERHGQGQLQHHMEFSRLGDEDDNLTDASITSTSTPPPPPTQQQTGPHQTNMVATGMPPPPPFDPPAEELDLSPQGPAVSVENVLHTWGGVYIGEWAADQPHGRGTLQLRNGQFFQGAFRGGLIHHTLDEST